MKHSRKIYHNTLTVQGEQDYNYLLITEVCRETNAVIVSYAYLAPEWASQWNFREFEFYHPLFN